MITKTIEYHRTLILEIVVTLSLISKMPRCIDTCSRCARTYTYTGKHKVSCHPKQIWVERKETYRVFCICRRGSLWDISSIVLWNNTRNSVHLTCIFEVYQSSGDTTLTVSSQCLRFINNSETRSPSVIPRKFLLQLIASSSYRTGWAKITGNRA